MLILKPLNYFLLVLSRIGGFQTCHDGEININITMYNLRNYDNKSGHVLKGVSLDFTLFNSNLINDRRQNAYI
jgi:hypothetical protein